MAFLVLALSCLSCADKGMPSKSESVQYELVKEISNQDNDKDDNCSPFCQCACCPGFSVNHPLLVSDFSIEHISLKFPSHISFDLLGLALPIWQPPQLV